MFSNGRGQQLSEHTDAVATGSPHVYALLINGGGTATTNYLSHIRHLKGMMDVLTARGIPKDHITVFCADGEEPGNDMAIRRAVPEYFWLIEGTQVGKALNTIEVINTVWEGVTLTPARKSELRQWFMRMHRVLQPGDTLLIFVTDHGTRNVDDPGNGAISLWNESLSVLEFKGLLSYLTRGVRVVQIMSQCFSGTFAETMIPPHTDMPDGSVCGFYATTQDRPAYGCYPDTEDNERMGHAVRFIDAMKRHVTAEDIHATVLVTDTSPDIPVSSSDLFLERLLTDHASSENRRLEDLIDSELAISWKDAHKWQRHIKLLDRLAYVYGIPSVRSYAEVSARIEHLTSLATDVATYEQRWKGALDDMRNELLEQFLGEHTTWKERLDTRQIQSLDSEEKRALLEEFLSSLASYYQRNSELWHTLTTMHTMRQETRRIKFSIETRLAALLRMRAILVRIGALNLLERIATVPHETVSETSGLQAHMQALLALQDCERTPLGTLRSGHQEGGLETELPDPLPPMSEEQVKARRIAPSWLGVHYRAISDEERTAQGLPQGAAIIEAVYKGGPAHAANVRPNDIVLGPPGNYFARKNQIRVWTMTAPPHTPLVLEILRNGKRHRKTVTLVPHPSSYPELLGTPQPGDKAPALTHLTPIGRQQKMPVLKLAGQRHMLFFMETTCPVCKRALPELAAWSRWSGTPVVAVSKQDKQMIQEFLNEHKDSILGFVARDEGRLVHQTYGVSVIPTFVLVNEAGVIEWRQAGYNQNEKGLGITGWSYRRTGR